MNVVARRDIKEQTIRAVVTRADGRVEDLGVISYHHKNPLRRWAWNVMHPVKSIGRLKARFARNKERA